MHLPRRNQGEAWFSVRYLGELDAIVILSKKGDVLTVDVSGDTIYSDDEELMVEVNEDEEVFVAGVELVGVIDDGLLDASWSPDEEVLCLLTGKGNLLTLTSEFNELSEQPLPSSVVLDITK